MVVDREPPSPFFLFAFLSGVCHFSFCFGVVSGFGVFPPPPFSLSVCVCVSELVCLCTRSLSLSPSCLFLRLSFSTPLSDVTDAAFFP